MNNIYNALLIVCILLINFNTVAQEHQASRMLVPAPSNKEAPVDDYHKIRAKISNEFSSAYEKQGKPAIAIFWNRKFDDQLSQWYQEVRYSKTGETAVKGQDKFDPKGGVEPSYERNVSGGGKIVSSEYIETRQKNSIREGFSEPDSFDFSAGFTTTVLSIPVKILDRRAIMRLMQRDNADEAGAEMISDYQKIETDALIGYADYLAEIILTPDTKADTGWAFMVSVKSVSDGQVVAMFKSQANKPIDPDMKVKWVVTEDGYEKQTSQREIGSPNEAGEQLAFETMEALSKIWK